MKLSKGANQRTVFRCLVAEPLRCYAETNKLIINCYFQCQNAQNSHCILTTYQWLAFLPLKIGTVDFLLVLICFLPPSVKGANICQGTRYF